MTLHIHSIGTATPEHSVDQAQAAEIANSLDANDDAGRRVLSTLYRMTRVERRHSILLDRSPEDEPRQTFFWPATDPSDRGPTTEARIRKYAEHAPQLAVAAARGALLDSDVLPDQITHIVNVSCTGFVSPGIDHTLIGELGLRPTVGRVQVGFMGCHGALNGLRVAEAFATAEPDSCVMLSAVELCSLHYQYGHHREQTVSNALFADGAAVVIGTGKLLGRSEDWRVAVCGSCLLPDSLDAMTWRIGDHGFQMTLSSRVPTLIRDHLRPWLASWLGSVGHATDDIPTWAIHPGGPRVVREVTKALDVPLAAAAVSNAILRGFGNMSSPTVLFVLQRLQQLKAPRPCVALAFGPGLVVEAVLFT